MEIITKFFYEMFDGEETDLEHIKPAQMKVPFTETEVRKAINSLKNNKSAGIDNIKAEQLKYGTSIINKGIAKILNDTAKTGKYPKEIKERILIPLPKPGKPKGPVGNLRSIILLSILRKILAICMIRRTVYQFNELIPITQAAYREGRSTTEMVYTVKTLAEKAITSKDYEINVLLVDMSKAFDTVNRKTLIYDLKKILGDDEMHILKIFLENVSLQVRQGNTLRQKIITKVGVPQGDCLSPILFTPYLAQALDEKSDEDHNYARKINRIDPPHLKDHNYAKQTQDQLYLEQQYADDISYITMGVVDTI